MIKGGKGSPVHRFPPPWLASSKAAAGRTAAAHFLPGLRDRKLAQCLEKPFRMHTGLTWLLASAPSRRQRCLRHLIYLSYGQNLKFVISSPPEPISHTLVSFRTRLSPPKLFCASYLEPVGPARTRAAWGSTYRRAAHHTLRFCHHTCIPQLLLKPGT